MKKRTAAGVVAIAGWISACGAAHKAPAVASATTTSNAAAAANPAEKPASEGEIEAFLKARAGEEPAASTPVPGTQTTPEERALFEKCEAAAGKARAATKTLSIEQQSKAVLKAMEAVDKGCFHLELQATSRDSAELDDDLAQTEMRLVAKAVTASPASCGSGAPNPVVPAGSCSKGDMSFDGPGWSCILGALPADDKSRLSMRAAYVYSFRVDARLRAYEVVARGCHATLSGSDTELVLRGRLGQAPDDAPILRRAPTR